MSLLTIHILRKHLKLNIKDPFIHVVPQKKKESRTVEMSGVNLNFLFLFLREREGGKMQFFFPVCTLSYDFYFFILIGACDRFSRGWPKCWRNNPGIRCCYEERSYKRRL